MLKWFGRIYITEVYQIKISSKKLLPMCFLKIITDVHQYVNYLDSLKCIDFKKENNILKKITSLTN